LIKQVLFSFSLLLLFIYSCQSYPDTAKAISAEAGKGSVSDFQAIDRTSMYANESIYPPGMHDTLTAVSMQHKISEWDVHIISYSDTLGWDWRLLASLIWQESRFNPDVTSFAGAYGLMQILPSTGHSMGIDVRSSPENNIRAGVRYLSYLSDFFDGIISDPSEKVKFVLASYNAGAGNIVDAMKLAEKYGRDPLKWEDNVEWFLLRKSDPFYYNDPVVKNGRCRGEEPVNFVKLVLSRYSVYQASAHKEEDRPFVSAQAIR
jgi:membrane-bound lytic murein transglycosylase MltF